MKAFTEKEAENFLERENFKVIKREFAKDKKDILKISRKIAFPWAMKISSKKVVHKKKIGGVILDIKNIEEADRSFEKLSKIENFEQVIIQPLIKGRELIVGLKKTPEFNLVIMLGAGGSNVEEKKDIVFRVCPIKGKDADDMIKELRSYSLIETKVDSSLIRDTLLKISKLAEKYPDIQELDINPLMVDLKEAIVVDARIIFN